MAWLNGWKYRKKHIILGSSSGTVTDYQIRITVHYGSGTDSGEHVYLNGKCRADFGDIRFTKSDGKTIQPYWIEEKVDGDYAVFWVKLDYIPPDGTTIYVYYGNPEATDISNGSSTFPLYFDDFEDGQLTNYTVETVGPGADTANPIVEEVPGFLHMLIDDTRVKDDAGVRVYWNTSITENNVAFRGYIRFIGLDPYLHFDESGFRYAKVRYDYRPYLSIYEKRLYVDSNYATLESLSSDWDETIYLTVAVYYDGGVVKAFKNDTLWGSVNATPTTPHIVQYLVYCIEYPSRAELYVYHAFVRKYIEPEPSHGAWGREEKARTKLNKLFRK